MAGASRGYMAFVAYFIYANTLKTKVGSNGCDALYIF